MATSTTEPTKKSQKVSHDTTLTFPSTAATSSSTTKSPKASTSTAVRHLEKRRNSTCQFADRVARVALDEYRKRIPIEHQQPATCIAAIVAHDANQQEEDRQLVVVGLGVGTKFLTQETLLQETKNENYYGRRVRDCHAEVLARRAFRRQLLWMIYQDLQPPPPPPPPPQQNEIKRGTDDCDEPHQSTSNHASLPNLLLQRVPSVVVAATPSYSSANDHKHQPTSKHAHCYYYSLRPGVTLHMYSSTTPCGNAALKKFAKMEKERFLEHLGDNEWPTSPPHPVVEPHSWKLGQFSLLLKRDTQATACATESTVVANNDVTSQQESTTGKTTNMTDHPLEQACPPGTCTVGNDRGVVHTCSDKICRWNCLGLQGSLLSSLLQEPLYLSTLTVGRKLTACICRRAVCCRVGKDGDKVIGWPQSQLPSSSSQQAVSTTPLFHLVHPAVMGTSVYVDEDAAIDMSANDHGVKGQDVRFHSSLSWAWWPGKEFETTQDAAQDCSKAECIDGTTGFCGDPTVSVEAKGPHSSLARLDDDPVVSWVSTAALSRLFLEIEALRASRSPEQLDAEGKLLLLFEVSPPTSLVELLSLKQRVAPLYEAAKEELLTRHPVLRNWKRRAVVKNPGYTPPTNTKKKKLQDARKQQQNDES